MDFIQKYSYNEDLFAQIPPDDKSFGFPLRLFDEVKKVAVKVIKVKT